MYAAADCCRDARRVASLAAADGTAWRSGIGEFTRKGAAAMLAFYGNELAEHSHCRFDFAAVWKSLDAPLGAGRGIGGRVVAANVGS